MFTLILILISLALSTSEDVGREIPRPLVVLPIPLELPYRNERAQQCWMRIEDVELTETYIIYCQLANLLLERHISEYNIRKQNEDVVEVTLWTETAPMENNEENIPYSSFNGKRTVKDWRTTTYFDPTSKIRVYVSEKADCRLIMYSRESMTNYKVNCERALFFINDNMTSSSGHVVNLHLVLLICISVIFYII